MHGIKLHVHISKGHVHVARANACLMSAGDITGMR